MTKKDYIDSVIQFPDNEEKIKKTSEVYETEIDGVIAKIISFSDNADFVGEERRVLSYNEIVNASKEYDKDFKTLGIIPVIDAYDNDLIVYVIAEKAWAKYSLSDDVIFKKRNILAEVI